MRSRVSCVQLFALNTMLSSSLCVVSRTESPLLFVLNDFIAQCARKRGHARTLTTSGVLRGGLAHPETESNHIGWSEINVF